MIAHERTFQSLIIMTTRVIYSYLFDNWNTS